ncbi:MAG: nicotinate (nicotinamide) nucleotide adenylyltransferase, partial [Ureaplasma sp.]|nr:nicotinate (nicotinamide) nucleotide adenylyltransferase [Ureaplasma sp.]
MKQQSSKKQILIFGGSFDPIHYGHISMLQAAIQTIKPDLTIIVPNFISPHKDKFFITANQKLDLLNLAFKNWDNLIIEDFELKNQSASYFINTLNYLIEKYPDANFNLLIGTDQYFNFSEWKNYKQIISKLNKVLVYPRKLKHIKNKNPFLKIKYFSKFKFLKYDPID